MSVRTFTVFSILSGAEQEFQNHKTELIQGLLCKSSVSSKRFRYGRKDERLQRAGGFALLIPESIREGKSTLLVLVSRIYVMIMLIMLKYPPYGLFLLSRTARY